MPFTIQKGKVFYFIIQFFLKHYNSVIYFWCGVGLTNHKLYHIYKLTHDSCMACVLINFMQFFFFVNFAFCHFLYDISLSNQNSEKCIIACELNMTHVLLFYTACTYCRHHCNVSSCSSLVCSDFNSPLPICSKKNCLKLLSCSNNHNLYYKSSFMTVVSICKTEKKGYNLARSLK